MFEGLKKLFEKKKIDEEVCAEQTATVSAAEENSVPSAQLAEFVADEGAEKQEAAEKTETVEAVQAKACEEEAKLHDDSPILLGGKSGFVNIETVENCEQAAKDTAEEVASEREQEETFSYEQADEPIKEDIATEPARKKEEKEVENNKEISEEAAENPKEKGEKTTPNLDEAYESAEEKAEREQEFGLDIEDTAKLFGMSKESLETEFKIYKADKFAARVALSVCDLWNPA